MKIVFVGTVEFSKNALAKLIDLRANIAGTLTKAKSNFNADFADITDICRRNGIPYKYVTDINLQENTDWIKNLKADIIFCFGFSQILKRDILNITPMGVIGFHPAKLPQNRGRHPIVWPLVLGLRKTASTFFFMDEGVDSGDILSQADIDITYEDDARTLYDKVTETALRQIKEFIPKLQDKSYIRTPQAGSNSNLWRKRTKEDGEIDFRMSSRAIYNLVRALTRPYVGAHLVYGGSEIKVWKVKEVEMDLPNVEYGKVLDIRNNQILVKCFDNAVLLVEHEFGKLPKAGDYIS